MLLGLGCSACGNGTHVVTVRQPLVHRLPITRTGVGSESLGTFAMHGWLYVKATCVGTGKFGVCWNKDGAYAACQNSRLKPTVKTASNFSVYSHRARIYVRAHAGMKWWVIVFEGPESDNRRATSVW